MNWLFSMFSSDGFMPHGMCYLWRPSVLTLHVTSDALIALAYFSIPITLLRFLRLRRDLSIPWVFFSFAIFIVACGATHLFEIWTIWDPVYWLSGSVKAITAVASVATAILLVRLMPQASMLPSPATLQRANEELEREISERRRADERVRRTNEELELRVQQRTRELEDANRNLLVAYDELKGTQRAAMRQARLHALGQMASGIAHDINNAVSPIALYTESLLERESGLSAQGRRQIATIQRAIENVADTVARMREFGRVRETQLLLEQVDLNALLTQVIDMTRARWYDLPQRQGVVIELRTQLYPALPMTLGATDEIRDALTNLIFNATDAMPHGGTLTLRSGVLSANEPELPGAFIEVCDTGVGMDEETRAHCLEPFFTTKGEHGTGLGLAMVQAMVHRHSAELDIDTRLGAGTRVRLTFRPSAQPALMPEAVVTPSAPAARWRLLVVDDDPIVLESLRITLEADGHLISTAGGGQAGIDAFQRAMARGEPFDLVFTDLGMPHVDGRRVAAALRAMAPSTPIVMLTGWGQKLVAENDVPPQVDRILSKPPRLQELRATMAELMASPAATSPIPLSSL